MSALLQAAAIATAKASHAERRQGALLERICEVNHQLLVTGPTMAQRDRSGHFFSPVFPGFAFTQMPIEYGANHVEKRLSARERNEPEAIARLRSEAALLSHLSPLCVTPRLLESGEDALGPWHRIERVWIPTLAERLVNAPLDPSWIERAVHAAFGALSSLHEAADASGPLLVVHADLSPANVAVDDAASRAVVLDLDLAWWRDGPTRDGSFRGTIAYVAPEIARGERPSPRSDLFALAATLLHAATGRPPRSGSSFAALIAEAAEAPLSAADHHELAARGPGHAALLACLAHDPAARPASARAVLAAAR